MYKLTYFKATNIAGFVSGLQRKTFEVDLREFTEKEIIVILGDNGTGKSTFLSFVHPLHTPTNKKKKFVMEGKEGSIVREYTADDGTIIVTRAIYTPSGTKHNSKLFFKILYSDGEEKELNPNGNVSSYYELVKEYFGISQDFINFASYNNTVKGIVSMTDSERKSNVSPLMPNTSRFEIAHNIINEKYKEYRSIMRNISQKIIKLRDEPLLKSELRRIERTINEYTDSRELLIRKTAKCDGRIKELSDGKDIDELMKIYKNFNNEINGIRVLLKEVSYVAEYDFDNTKKTKSCLSINLNELTKKQLIYNDRMASLKKKLYEDEDKADKLEILIGNLASTDLEDLYSLKKEYEKSIKSIRYNPSDKFYSNKDYKESILLIESMGKLSESISAILESYGEIISTYWKENGVGKTQQVLSKYQSDINYLTATKDQLRSELMDVQVKMGGLNEYRNLEEILSRRPSECKIDSCPFIIEALKWNDINKRLETLQEKHDSITAQIESTENKIDVLSDWYSAIEDLGSIERYLMENDKLMMKYLNISSNDIRLDISRGLDRFGECIKRLEDIAAILSEKDMYQDITKSKLPDIEKQIKIYELNDVTNRYLVETYEGLKKSISKTIDEISKIEKRLLTLNATINGINKNLETYDTISNDIDKYIDLNDRYIKLTEFSDDYSERLSTISTLLDKQLEYEKEIKNIDKYVSSIMVSREQYRYELNSLLELKAEKETIEQEFNITYIMKSIIQPGKGLWKEILEIYMFDIKNITNQLLLNTFNGNLYLEDFIILDDSFIIPYVYKGVLGADISLASDSQQTTISTSMSLAILSKMISKYGILTYDEADKDLSPLNKEGIVNILVKQSRYVGITQNFTITHSPEYYDPYDVGYILFPGSTLKNKKSKDIIEI